MSTPTIIPAIGDSKAQRIKFDNYSVVIDEKTLIYILPHPEHGEEAVLIDGHFNNEIKLADQGIQKLRIEFTGKNFTAILNYQRGQNVQSFFDFFGLGKGVNLNRIISAAEKGQ